jgi:hypothetical protein
MGIKVHQGEQMIFHIICRWKSFKVYHLGWKGPSPYFLKILYNLIHIKTNEPKIVKYFISTIFLTIIILNYIIIIHKCVFTW